MMTLALGACASERTKPSDGEAYDAAVADFEAMLDKVERLAGTLNAVLVRRTHVIQVQGTPDWGMSASKPVRPSELYAKLAGTGPARESRAFASLLDRAAAREATGTLSSLDCVEDAFSDSHPSIQLEPSPLRERTARRLDAVLRVKIARCPPKGIQINSPAANQPSRTDSVAMKAETDLRALQSLDEPLTLGLSDVPAVLLGQAYYFDQTEDGRVPLGTFLQRAVEQAFGQVNAAFDRAELPRGPSTIVFDRVKTSVGSSLNSDRRGWFNAVASESEIYVSPTIARAAVVTCAKRISITPSYALRLKEMHRDLKRRYLTPSDVRKQVALGVSLYESALLCVAEQLTFLLAHEVAHRRLPTTSESVADCVGAAITASLQRPVPGLFGTLIFNLVETEDEELLGAGRPALTELACRRSAPWIVRGVDQQDLRAQIAACRAEVQRCGAVGK
ncbi:hypothetical protein [Ottowia sp.]|uniref:hypothetical protein n=1 Tax=Ottowia sp. TaxID=1898956 RepID=UPI0025CBEAEA|nr:hypothetical protein [Ottowia sp.]